MLLFACVLMCRVRSRLKMNLANSDLNSEGASVVMRISRKDDLAQAFSRRVRIMSFRSIIGWVAYLVDFDRLVSDPNPDL